jgi:hypothetical protein
VAIRRSVHGRHGRAGVLGQALALAAVAAALVIVLTQGDDDPRAPTPTATATPTATPTPTPTPLPLAAPAGGPSLAVGITEPNPNLVAAPGARTVPPQWARWRDELAAIRPVLYRLVVDWSAVQPRADAPPNLDAPEPGCMRVLPPCAAFGGVRDQLRALASRQRQGGWEALVVITGTPNWAGRARPGCTESGGGARAQPLSRAGLAAYRALVAEVLAAAAEEGATLRWWSAWNEPNHPLFLAPQRAACDAAAGSVAVASYVDMAGALRRALKAAPGEQRYVLGELAGLYLRSPKSTTIAEFIAGLPRRLVCGTTVWSQHGYLEGRDHLDDIEAGLRAKRCGHRHAVWMTETGTGVAHAGTARGGSEKRSCRQMHRRLADWYADRRVTAAFQYTFREDDLFPTGLVTTDLSAAYPVLKMWQAWGMQRRPSPAAPPPERSRC